jgi:hypothetical protein
MHSIGSTFWATDHTHISTYAPNWCRANVWPGDLAGLLYAHCVSFLCLFSISLSENLRYHCADRAVTRQLEQMARNRKIPRILTPCQSRPIYKSSTGLPQPLYGISQVNTTPYLVTNLKHAHLLFLFFRNK